MMELGATVCLPKSPQCSACPVSRWCRAHKLGLAAKLPSPRRKPRPVRVAVTAAVLLDPQGRTLLVRKQKSDADGALFSRLWQFPAVEVSGSTADQAARALVRELGVSSACLQPLPPVRHTVTYRQVTVNPFLVRVPTLSRSNGHRIVPLVDLGRLPVSSATRKIAKAAILGENAR